MPLPSFLGTLLQLALFGGAGGAVLLNYATKGIVLTQGESETARPRFASDYDELEWLEERQKAGATEEETLRFYELRDRWTDMHADLPTEATSSGGPFRSMTSPRTDGA